MEGWLCSLLLCSVLPAQMNHLSEFQGILWGCYYCYPMSNLWQVFSVLLYPHLQLWIAMCASRAQIDVLLLKLTHFLHKCNAVRELWEKAGRITSLTFMGFKLLPPRSCCFKRQFPPCYKGAIVSRHPIVCLWPYPKSQFLFLQKKSIN